MRRAVCRRQFLVTTWYAATADIVSSSGHLIPWVKEIRYLDITLYYIVSSTAFRCSFGVAKRSFYKATNAILEKIGGKASEEVT